MIGRAVGRGAKWIGQGAIAGGAGTRALVGGAALYGAASGILDRQGPYPRLQEAVYGDPEAFRASLKAGISSAITPNHDLPGPIDNYYGQSVNMSYDSSARGNPVDGSVVFGMYNLRRT